MIAKLRVGHAFRLAISLAGFAALCLVLPPAVLAMGHGANTIQCLTHADSLDHDMVRSDAKGHGDHAPPAGDHHANCCGLFCQIAIVADGDEAADVAAAGLPQSFFREPRLLSRAPDRPDHPPKSLLSV
jgi:hypothetical protein